MLPGLTGTAAARRRELLARRPEEFRSGYPAQVWAYEAARATADPRKPVVSKKTRLAGEWPITEEQKAFFNE
jgi:hypothetical protein